MMIMVSGEVLRYYVAIEAVEGMYVTGAAKVLGNAFGRRYAGIVVDKHGFAILKHRETRVVVLK
jgi:hypothetical protein